jgi:putative FmdB family regulatory protein
MPIYEYACDRCGVFEEMQRITAEPLKKCPTCRGKVRRLISQTSFQLKGSGWYVTDYARKDGGGKKKGEGGAADAKGEGAAKDEGGKADAKAESKPAASGAGEKKAS